MLRRTSWKIDRQLAVGMRAMMWKSARGAGCLRLYADTTGRAHATVYVPGTDLTTWPCGHVSLEPFDRDVQVTNRLQHALIMVPSEYSDNCRHFAANVPWISF